MEKPRRLLPEELEEMQEEEFDWVHLKTVQDIETAIAEKAPEEYKNILRENLRDINKYISDNQEDN